MTESDRGNLDFINCHKGAFVCFLLVLLVVAIYWPVAHYGFINFDDNLYVTGNPYVKSGITQKGVAWAFNFEDKKYTYWHPLTWISHMSDVQLSGMHPGRHHLINVLFHIANTLLFFLVLVRMTGATWRAAFAAALFAVHPLNVESVAWIAERKNVLSTFFWLLTLLAYVAYTTKPGAGRYLVVMLLFILGLLAKPMLVCLPFVLLLLDYWPLGRIQFRRSIRFERRIVLRLILEKIPLLVLSALAILIASASLLGRGSYITLQAVPLRLRIVNALVSYVGYLSKVIWPQHLAVFYPYPDGLPVWQSMGAFLFLVGSCLLVLWAAKDLGYLAVGWFWFLGTLVPVSGVVQAGLWPAMADRWAYVPMMGLCIMMAWGLSDLQVRFARRRPQFGVVALVWLAVYAGIAHFQVQLWRNSLTVFGHALEVTRPNYVAHTNFGRALAALGKNSEAFQHYAAALRINPDSAHVQVNYGTAELDQGNLDDALRHFEKALKINPGFPQAYNNIGLALVRKGQIAESIKYFRTALKIKPDFSNARRNLNLARSLNNRLAGAGAHLLSALQLRPDSPDLNLKMRRLSESKSEVIAALSAYQKALVKQPGFTGLKIDTIAAVSKAMQVYERSLQLLLDVIIIQPDCADAYYHIACLYARQGKIHESLKWLERSARKGFNTLHLLESDPDLAKARTSSGFEVLYKEIKKNSGDSHK